MALMFRHDSTSGSAAASMAVRSMPLDHRSWPPINTMALVGRAAGPAVGVLQAAALAGAHGSVVELEVEVADLVVLLVADLPEGAALDRLVRRNVSVRAGGQMPSQSVGRPEV